MENNEKMKIDSSTWAIVFMLVVLIIGGTVFHFINKNRENDVSQGNIVHNQVVNNVIDNTNNTENSNTNENR